MYLPHRPDSTPSTMSKQDKNKKRTTVFPVSRLKKIMQSNESVGKLGASVPVVASKAIELFLKEFVGDCIVEMKNKEGRRLTNDHIDQVIKKNPKYVFLQKLYEKH